MKKIEPEKPMLYQYCLRCGRKLVDEENRQRGMGKICWEKAQVEKKKKHQLF